MKFKLMGTEVYVSFLFAAVVAFMLAIDRTGLIIPTLLAILLHETGHLFAMWIMDCNPKSVRLIPVSVQIVRSFSPKPQGELAIALCGPIVNLVVFVALFSNWVAYRNETVLIFALLNLILGAFNLLPVNGLDGGTVLAEILRRKYQEYIVSRVIHYITLTFAVVAVSVGIYMTVIGKFNLSVYIVALYFTVCAFLKK